MRPTRPIRTLFKDLCGLAASGALMAACGGNGAPPTTRAADPPTPMLRPGTRLPTSGECRGEADLAPGPSPLRRLNRAEYDNTVRDLLGDTSAPARGFVPEQESHGFDNDAASMPVTQLHAQQLFDAAEKLAASSVGRVAKAYACDMAALGERACAQQLIERFGKRAYRRPLVKGEVDRLLAVYDRARSDGDHTLGLRVVVETILQAPQFLYRIEIGAPVGPSAKTIPLTSYEVASRLSYFLWGTMPDDALFAAADAGKLTDAASIGAQARRMIGDPRARASVAHFHAQWLDIGKVAGAAKDPALFPELSDVVRDLMRTESEMFVDEVFWSHDPKKSGPGGAIEALLTAPYTLLNDSLAKYYGMQGPWGSGFVKVETDPLERRGVLTQGAILAVHAARNQTSPVLRGKFIRERFFCQDIPPPPPDVVANAPDPSPTASTRDRFAEHSRNPRCASCHRLMDPIGFGFEAFDAAGRVRARDGAFPIDARGELVGTDVDGPFKGAPELARKMAKSDQVKACVVTQWFRYAYGRADTAADRCTIASLAKKLALAKYDLRELLVAMTQTESFRARSAQGPSAPGGPGGGP